MEGLLVTTECDCEHGEVPESGEPVDPQQWTRGEFGQGLGEEEEGHRTPMFRAKLLDHLQQHTSYRQNTKEFNGHFSHEQ